MYMCAVSFCLAALFLNLNFSAAVRCVLCVSCAPPQCVLCTHPEVPAPGRRGRARARRSGARARAPRAVGIRNAAVVYSQYPLYIPLNYFGLSGVWAVSLLYDFWT